MILYSDRDDHYSQRVRIVLAEKDITAEINEAKAEDTPDEILSISPYHKLPILVDRALLIASVVASILTTTPFFSPLEG